MSNKVSRGDVRLVRIGTYFFTVFLCFFCFAGCESSHQLKENKETSDERELHSNEQTASFFEENSELPLKFKETQFHSVSEWKDDQTIFLIMNEASKSTIYTYNLLTKEKEKFYETKDPIVKIEANDKHNLFLIHTSPSNYEAELIILDGEGNKKFEKRIESHDLQYAWNKSNNEQLYVAAFNEDWTFQTYLFHIEDGTAVQNPVQAPFVQWLNNKELAYIKWNEDEPALSAPLFIYDLENKKETLFAENTIANSTFNQIMLTVKLIDEQGGGLYVFNDMKTKEKIISFETKLASLYSEWLVPYFALNDSTNAFYTFISKESENVFKLSKIDLQTSDETIILNNIENFPIKLSPNGRYLLYGPRYEKIIDLQKREVKELIELSE